MWIKKDKKMWTIICFIIFAVFICYTVLLNFGTIGDMVKYNGTYLADCWGLQALVVSVFWTIIILIFYYK